MTASGQFRFPSCWGACRRSRLDLVAADRHARRGSRARPRAPRGRPPPRRSVGQRGDSGAHAPLRVRVQLLHRRLDPLAAVARAELRRAAARRARCAASCARRSPRRSSGLRMSRASASTSSSSSRVGGMTTPSSCELARVRGHARRAPCPPTSAWCARVTAKPSAGARDERDVGKVGAARVRVVDDVDARRAGSCAATAATASGIAPRCTGMCSAWATIRPRASKSAVEQSRRSLMFAENADRTSAAPISSATAAERARRSTWSSMFTLSARPVTVS